MIPSDSHRPELLSVNGGVLEVFPEGFFGESKALRIFKVFNYLAYG